MKDYNLRFSFTAVGEEGIAQLKAFRDRIVDLDSKALSQVYREFDIAPLQITPEDAVTEHLYCPCNSCRQRLRLSVCEYRNSWDGS